MRVGVDFDNTIACHDERFVRTARERGLLPAGAPPTKATIHDHLHRTGRVEAWRELQADVYGPGMADAVPFPGVHDFFRACARAGVPVFVISLRSRRPYGGPPHDLHASARAWLAARGFFSGELGLPRDRAFFEPTVEAKLDRIAKSGCTVFIDDRPRLLRHADFPAGVRRILFDPADAGSDHADYRRTTSWREIAALLVGDA